MEVIIYFFRDTLSGVTYYIVSTISLILILFCIKLLFNHNKKVKLADEKFKEEHVVLLNSSGVKEVIDISPVKVVNEKSILDTSNVKTTPTVVNSSNPSNKKVVMINPNEVANVASQMNLIGINSNQKKELNNNSTNQENKENVINTSTNIDNNDII